MAGVKSLAKDTAIYGVSSIIGRFLNWCLVPLYTICFPESEYGLVTYIYSFVALALVILTYGMETGFFRFANHERYTDPMEVYSTALISLGVSSTVFMAGVLVCLHPLSDLLKCGTHYSYVWLMAATVALDAFTAIPFSYLRFRKRPMRFALLRLINIGLNIALNIFFIVVCPWLWSRYPGTISWFYDPSFGVGYIFLANFITSILNLVLLMPELRGFRWRFNSTLWREMLAYSYPLLILGVAGIMNQTIDKILLPTLVADRATAMQQLGVYGANYKIAIIMVMFIQAFRFAYEPFIFAQSKEKGSSGKQSYSDAMKWFVIFALAIFLVVMFYLDIVRYFISPKYWEGLAVVPIIMIAEFFTGVFFNLSVWYKLTDRTQWGMWFTLTGLLVTLFMNWLLVPVFGYMGCAWAAFSCYFVMMTASYVVARRYYPINYHVGRLVFYFAVAMVLWCVSLLIAVQSDIINFAVRALLLIFYMLIVVKVEKIKLNAATFRSLIPHSRR
ncbi:MAG: oligosaccharide flippase family protein [Bacteroides sp.]|nr:oligosaccharide flippase family protein [Bacteroides sp.]MCM1413757.1 oligosaccharide flippase family protein [Bacteroides sp.]MCM1472224.1 oligosaccharide flippase family protein [Bacteroides sp.]